MKQSNRIILYFFGLFIITIGINLSIHSGLGISPISAFTYPTSRATQIPLGTITTIAYIVFVIIQICLLQKAFKWKHLLQVPFSIAFGFFISITGSVIDKFYVDNYFIQLCMLLLSVLICAIGASIYILMDIVPNAPEGLILSISQRFQIPFSKVKVIGDCIFVLLGLCISILFIGHVVAIREGTILSALCTGKLIGIFTNRWEPTLLKFTRSA